MLPLRKYYGVKVPQAPQVQSLMQQPPPKITEVRKACNSSPMPDGPYHPILIDLLEKCMEQFAKAIQAKLSYSTFQEHDRAEVCWGDDRGGGRVCSKLFGSKDRRRASPWITFLKNGLRLKVAFLSRPPKNTAKCPKTSFQAERILENVASLVCLIPNNGYVIDSFLIHARRQRNWKKDGTSGLVQKEQTLMQCKQGNSYYNHQQHMYPYQQHMPYNTLPGHY